jgi:8-oxo-dGTP pyrophosphatase MutT (NUDIX family)
MSDGQDPRAPLLGLLDAYAAGYPDETALVQRFRAFVHAHPDCLWRTCLVGHITASAWIVSPDGQRALLTHHRKLGRWLQLGGHVDGESHVERAACREAVEESGMAHFELVQTPAGLLPLDLDVHPIPARGAEPAHDHWDVRFLLRAAPGQELVLSDESHALRWFDLAGLRSVTDEESVLRLPRKAQRWLDLGTG